MFTKRSRKSLPALRLHLSVMLVYTRAEAGVNRIFPLSPTGASLLGGALEALGRNMQKGAINLLAIYVHGGHFGLRKK